MRINIIPHNTKIDFIKYRFITFAIALFVALISLIGMTTKGLNYGIDFKGGYMFEVHLNQKRDISEIREKMINLNLGEIMVQSFGSDKDLFIKIEKQDSDKAGSEGQEKVISSVKKILGNDVKYNKIETVGPKVGGELVESGIKAVGFALIAMILYIVFRFEWQFAFCAIMALIHDSLAILALFCFSPLEFNETAIIAVLITAGYSINDTIVIFDRIRENIKRYKNLTVGELINKSINETLSRTMLTATTTLIALLALYFFGGKIISRFSLPIIVGVMVGSFSSICLAAPMLLHLGLKTKQKEQK